MIRRKRRTASATVLALVLGTLVVLAFKHDGKPFTEVELNDGGVWVTNTKSGLVARLNPQIKELDLGLDAASNQFDVFQRATNLYLDDGSSDRSVKPVDIAQASLLDPTNLPTGAVVSHGGDTFAVVDPVTGKGWVRPARAFSAFSAKTTEPDVTGALTAAVGTDGRAYVLDREGRITVFTTDERGNAVEEDGFGLGGDDVGSDADLLTLTVVGDTPVLYDRNTSELSRPGADPVVIDVSDTTSVELQQPSPDDDDVYVATADGLYATPVGGGDLRKISRGTVAGRPAAPVSLTTAGCVYAAWADPGSPNNYLRECANDSFDDTTPIKQMQDGAVLRFRVNRDVVVLNDTVTGDTWLVQEPGKAKIDNWPQVDPKNENKSKLKETTEEVPDQENRPPEPNDDDLGARPGRSTVLPVVAINDHDPDGDIITISKVVHLSGPEFEVKIVGDGTQLQVAVPADAEGTSTFRYYVTDGRVNEEVWAEVHLRIHDDAENAKPEMMEDRKPRLTVARGATASYYVLADFFDMDGDDLTLSEVSARGGEVEFRPDGTITFTDSGAGSKVSEIQYRIEDGIDSYTGKLPVQVLGDTAPPELVPDLASGVAGTRVVVQPLSNDRNPEGRGLTLKNVKVIGDDAGTEISKDLDSGTFTFKSNRAKSYYLQYSAYNSSATKSSFIRLDIESPPKDNRRPIAVRDKAVITPGGTAQVDVLLNDLDPDGDVLVVKRISRPSIPGVKVSIVDKRLAVVSSATDIVGQQATVEYVISDGRSTAKGSLVITQRSSTQANRHPVANKDQATVRAGSVTTIPVLANDSDPDGGKPRLFQSDMENLQDLDVWVAGDALRLRAPEKPGSYSVIYGVRDADGLKAAAPVSIFVIADSAKNNHPPLPEPIIDRVISGRPKVISVDLGGADPDGDSVSFRSILTAPALGRIVDTGVDWIRYEAFDGKVGTDFFQILVQDKYGATGVAEVRVGVVPEETENQPPVALDDSVLIQPNRTISYNVLTNDVDPDDDPLRITELNSSTADPEAEDGFIELEIGDAPDNTTVATNVGYGIEDEAGAEDHAVLKIIASTSAPYYAPIARDDVAELGDIIGRDPGDSVDIPVLDNDLDFDGAKADLQVTDCDAGSKGKCDVVDGDTTVRVELKAEDQVVLYRLDDADEKSQGTFGVIFVTGTDNVPPQLTTDEDRVPVEAVAGETKVFDLTDLVVTRAGREPKIVPDTLPTAVNGAVSPVKGEATSLSFTPARGHVGPASVTVSVIDGQTTAEDSALTSLLTIPIDVKPSGNVAPTMRDAAVDVTAEGDPAQVDLAGLTRDANEDDLDTMAYSVRSAESGVSAKVDAGSSILAIESTGGADTGDVLRIEVVADDGHGGLAEATVSARIVGSDRPLTQVPVRNVTATRNELTEVDVSSYAVNPYLDEDKPIEVSSPTIESGKRVSELEAKGSVISFTPTTSGRSTIRFTVSDASGDQTRDVTGRINVTVVDVPEAPSRPTLSSVEATSAILSWREPEANGAAITEYEVKGPGFEQTCASTTCQLVDLTPGDTYTFTVRAKNSEGWSEESPPSAEIVPNRAPDLMTPPTIVVESKPTGDRMDRQLTVRWTPPNNEGSEITSYEIKEAGSGRTWTAGGNETSHVIPGLTNGTPYAFEIRAVNAVTPKREFSGASRAVAPFGLPVRSGVAPKLTASEDSPYSTDPWVRVEWSKWSDSQSNGNSVSRYAITCDGCNRSTYEVDASTSSKTFDANDGIRKGQTFTFTVAAINDAGTSDRSPSASGRPWTKPGPVGNLHEVGSSPESEMARLAWNPPADDGGLTVAHYVVRTNSGKEIVVQSAPGDAGTLIDFDGNGRHSATVWAVTRNDGRDIVGQADTAYNIDTWGKPGTPDVSDESDWYYEVELLLKGGSENGKSVTGVQYDDGSGWKDVNSGYRYKTGVPEGGSTRTIQVRTVSAATDDRRFSDAIPVTGTSLAKVLELRYAGGLGSCGTTEYCRVHVEGDGFVREPRAARVDISLLGTNNCEFPFQTTVNGRINFRAGGDNCRVTGNGSISFTSNGYSRDFPR